MTSRMGAISQADDMEHIAQNKYNNINQNCDELILYVFIFEKDHV